MTDFRTIFAAADAKSSAAVSRVFGGDIELHPWMGGGYSTSGMPDSTRASVTFTGNYLGAIGRVKASGDRAGRDAEGYVSTRNQIISADFVDWPAHATKGDRIRVMSEALQPWFVITAINDDGVNRVFVTLTRLT